MLKMLKMVIGVQNLSIFLKINTQSCNLILYSLEVEGHMKMV